MPRVNDTAPTFLDLVVAYRTRLFRVRISALFQLNVRNLTDGAHLQPAAACPEGSISSYRMIDPRESIFTVTFDLWRRGPAPTGPDSPSASIPREAAFFVCVPTACREKFSHCFSIGTH